MHGWSLDADEDFEDLELVEAANPASWQTMDRLRDRRDSPSMTDWQWRRFACGQWVRGEQSAIDPAEWDALCDPSAVIPPGSTVFVGLGSGVAGPGHHGDCPGLVAVRGPPGDR